MQIIYHLKEIIYNLKEKIDVYNWYLLEIASIILNNPEIVPCTETDMV